MRAKILCIGNLRHVEHLGLHLRGIDSAYIIEVLVPQIAVHSANRRLPFAIGKGRADSRLLSVTSHIEVFEVNDNLLSNGQIGEQTTLGDVDKYAPCCIFDAYTIIDVALNVVACYASFNLHIVLHLFIRCCLRCENIGVVLLQLANGNHFCFFNARITIRLAVVGVVPILVHTANEGCTSYGDERISYFHVVIDVLITRPELVTFASRTSGVRVPVMNFSIYS